MLTFRGSQASMHQLRKTMHPSSRRAHGICFDRVSRGGRARRCAAAKRRAGGRFCSPRRPSATRRPSLTSSSTRPSSGAPRPAAPRRRSAALRLRLRCRSGAARGFARCSSWEAAGGGVRARSRGGGAPSRLLCGCAESDQKVAGLHSASSASRSVLAPQPLQLPARPMGVQLLVNRLLGAAARVSGRYTTRGNTGAAFGAPEPHAGARDGSTTAWSPDSQRAAARSASAQAHPEGGSYLLMSSRPTLWVL